MASQNPCTGDGVHLSFSHDASCFIAIDTAAVQWRCCDTFKLRGYYPAENARRAITAAAGDMHDPNRSTCAVVRRVAHASYVVKRFRPGSINYRSHYEAVQIDVDASDVVRSVHVHGDKTVVVHAGRVDMFGLDGVKTIVLQRRVETGDNPLGLCAVSRGPESPFAFACPGMNAGDVRVERWVGEFMPLVIHAHTSRLASIAMSWDAQLVATASVKGTIVRVFRIADGALLQKVRSLAQFRLREGKKYLAAFGNKPHTVLIIGMDGSFYRCQFDPEKGGEMKQLENMNFLKMLGR
ncbi:hypothetical protein E2562_020461 [Oryza meyeriana var. granulata]|uniref:Uncharacterized protein n=1 Tax=Oryza meyeriana var. granulata TaxID=110450 RepID=A0A6G1D5P6_9ORYZ|nr:hypothetical protein E2562_020461 [Oryza meyeriana var. granulata]